MLVWDRGYHTQESGTDRRSLGRLRVLICQTSCTAGKPALKKGISAACAIDEQLSDSAQTDAGCVRRSRPGRSGSFFDLDLDFFLRLDFLDPRFRLKLLQLDNGCS